MYSLIRSTAKSRVISSRVGSVLLLFQRTPLVQMLFPEARILGGAGLGEITAWTIATITGLGAYDSVAGATTLKQLAPTPDSLTVTTAVGANLAFVFQITGTESSPKSWQIIGTIPDGLTHANTTGVTTDSISGVPTTAGSYPITVRAWEGNNNTGNKYSQNFTISVGAAIITAHPQDALILSGDTATLSVSAGGGATYQWYQGTSPNTANLLTNKTSASFTTPALTSNTKYWVRVIKNGLVSDSDTATVKIGNAPAVTTQPVSKTINSGGTATLTVAFSGTAPDIQWYRGASGNTNNPMTGETSTSFTTPALTSNTNYWARATNSLGSDDSAAATITVRIPPAITTQPLPVTINSGNTASFTVAASGTSPSFQWYIGNSGVTTNPVSGATGTSLTSSPLTSNTKFWVRASNAAGTADSNAVIATVIVPPQITSHPGSTNIASGSTATLNVAASGSSPAFQWYLGNSGDTSSPVNGATLANFTTPPLTSARSYWVKASNAAGTANSNTATVSISSTDPFADWQSQQFSAGQLADPLVSGPDADPDGDGISNRNEHVFGFLPLTGNPSPAPAMTLASGQFTLEFVAKLASGPGYAGLARHYALESGDALDSPVWTAIPGYTDITGNDQAVSYSAPVDGPHRFYRLSVTLRP